MGFESFHPAINLLYFAAVLAGALCFHQPVFLLISYLSAFLYSVRRCGRRGWIFNLTLLPLIVAFGLYYAGYHHFGVTVLGTNFIGNSITLESLLWGLSLGATAACFLMWMECVLSVFTADKVVYLLGRVSPRMALYLALTLRMLPRIHGQARRLRIARCGVGMGPGQGNFFRRLANGMKVLSMVITWTLDSLMGVAASMKSRGCGLRGRTAFSIYRFDYRDRSVVLGLSACISLVLMGHLLGQTAIVYDPRVVYTPVTAASYLFYGAYGVLCLWAPGLEWISRRQFEKRRRAI